MLRRRHRRAIVALFGCVLAACNDNSTGPSPAETGLRIVAGGTGTDTIGTQFAQALLVELRDDDGRPMPDHVIRFESVPHDEDSYFPTYTAYVSPVDDNAFTVFVSDTTDARGQARVLVKLGSKAGPALVIVSDPDHGRVDTATYTVEPGRAVAVRAEPADTTIYVGATFAVRTTVLDRAGNPRTDAVTHAAVGSAATVSGSTVSGATIGVGRIVSTSGTAADTISVSVPPPGVLAAFTPRGLAAFKTDGSELQVLAPEAASRGQTASWSPAGTEVAFDESCCSGRIQVASLAGGGARFITPAGSGTLYPKFSRDGQWVYYTRLSRLQRVRPDGTGEEPVPMLTPGVDGAPSFSPDGSRMVYARLTCCGADQLWMLDVASGTSTNLNVQGHYPAWSPGGNLIAFVANGDGSKIKVMNPDGTGVRTVAAADAPYSLGIDWSTDGQWIVARSTRRDRVELINAASGEIIPLTYTRSYTGGVSWKP